MGNDLGQEEFYMLRVFSLTLSLGVVLALLAGCASFEGFSPPDVALVDLSLSDVTLYETSGTFTVRLSNENRDPMAIEGGVYTLSLAGAKVGKGLSNRHLEVPALSTATVEVDVHISNLALASRLVKLLKEPVLDYTLKSKIYVRRPYGLKRVRFSKAGTLELPRGEGRETPGLSPETLDELIGEGR
jgi:LEA14-like dessication related protein